MTLEQLDEIQNVIRHLLHKTDKCWRVRCVDNRGVYVVEKPSYRFFLCVEGLSYESFVQQSVLFMSEVLTEYVSKYPNITYRLGYDYNRVSFFPFGACLPKQLFSLIREDEFSNCPDFELPEPIIVAPSNEVTEQNKKIVKNPEQNIKTTQTRISEKSENISTDKPVKATSAKEALVYLSGKKQKEEPSFAVNLVSVKQPHAGAHPLHRVEPTTKEKKAIDSVDVPEEDVVEKTERKPALIEHEIEDFPMPELKNTHGIQELKCLNMPFWKAFRDRNISKEFKMRYKSESSNNYKAEQEVEALFRYIAARNDSAHKKKLLACLTLDEFQKALERIIVIFYRPEDPRSKVVVELLFKYLDFILDKEFELSNPEKASDVEAFDFGGITLMVAPSAEKKAIKKNEIEITYPNGVREALQPIDAMIAFLNYVGFERVAERNWKMFGMPFLTKYPTSDNKRNYKDLENGWFICVQGDTKLRLRTLIGLNESLNVGLKFKMV